MDGASEMDGQQFHDEAATCAHIQYAIRLAHSRLRDFAAKVIASKDSLITPEQVSNFKSKERDFNHTVYFIQKKWKAGGFLNLPNEKVLLSYLRRCPGIRNEVSHQIAMSTDSSDRAIETLCHIMKEIGFPQDAQRIRDYNKPTAVVQQGSEALKFSWELLKQKGNDHFKDGQYTEAMIIYTQALKENPEVPVLYSNRALSELKLGRYEDARNDAEDALQLDPMCIKYYRILSEALVKLELVEEALAVCKRGLQVDAQDGVLLVRVRDLNAVMVMRDTDKNPRKDPKDSIEGTPQFEENVLKYMQKCGELKPSPNDIHVVHAKEDLEEYFNLGKSVREGHNYYNAMRGRTKDFRCAFECFKNAADLGSAEGQFNVGQLYALGHGTNIDYGLMLKYYRLAASHKPFISLGGSVHPVLGVAEAENGLGCAYRDGRGVDTDMKKAFSHYIKAANWGLPEAQNNTGHCLYNGEGVALNLQFARMWYERAAKQGIAEGQMNYAAMLESGRGGPSDEYQAFEYYKKAAEQGSPGALEKMQYMSSNGAATITQQESFGKMVCDKSVKNDVQTLHFMGQKSKDDDNHASAISFWTKASEKGHLESTIALWKLLLEKKRNKEAFTYCTEAAEAGDAHSQVNLGSFLANGTGCKRNPDVARKWFRRAQHHFTLDAKKLEDAISAAKVVCDYEENYSLPTESLSWTDRVERYMRLTANLSRAAKDCLDQIDELCDQPKPVPLTFRLPTGEDEGQAILAASESGSVTAQNVVKATVLIGKAFDAWKAQEYDRTFALLRESHRYDDIVRFRNPDMAAYIDKRKLTTPDAMFVRACNFGNDIKGTTVYLERSIRFHPMEADFHYMLSSGYGFAGRYEESLGSARRAYELEQRPHWLYGIATAVRKLYEGADQQDEDYRLNLKIDALRAYQKFLEENPADERKVPAALFCIASLYCWQDADVQKAKQYYKRACEADVRRLPCFKAVDDGGLFPPKRHVEVYLSALEANTTRPITSNIENIAIEQANTWCEKCGEASPLYLCVCREAAYCGTECQTSNWRTHKQACKAKFAKMQKLRKM